MHAERDHLVRFVFPELKEKCRKLHVHLIDVDLRWGVTEKEAQEGKALDICLDEIDSCRPYFLGLLGQRYGHIPSGHDHSITAQEIFHGVLHNELPKQVVDLRKIIEGKLEGKALTDEQVNCLVRCYQYDPERSKYLLSDDATENELKIIRSIFKSYSSYQRDRSFFFFRSEALTEKLAGEHRSDFFEIRESLKVKLENLKQEIMAEGLPHFEYDDIEAFGHMVSDTLWKRIEAEIEETAEEGDEKDWLAEEAEFHELFIADRTRRFVGRRDVLDDIHTFCRGEWPISRTDGVSGSGTSLNVMLIAGDSGCGKSALLARFSEEAIHRYPDWLIIPHFVGASPSSTNLRQMLRRLCVQLNRSTGPTEDVPEDIKELIRVFPELLAQAARQKNILLIIDAVNQLERSDNAHEMHWFPQSLPDNVKIVISTLDGYTLERLVARQNKKVIERLKGLSEEDIRDLVNEYLKEITHKFPNKEIEHEFFNKVKAGNPLYILVALEELRIFGQFDMFGERVSTLPDTVSELFDQVLERIEGAFILNKGLVRDCMSFISCGRQGMTAEELQTLLKDHTPKIGSETKPEKLPDMLWARLYRAFSAYLFERSGVIDFFHWQLKEAVGTRYLKRETDRDKVHKVIADYFETRWQEPYVRALDELPHQRIKAKDWEGVERVLTDLRFIEKKCAGGMTYDLIADYNATLSSSDMPSKRNSSVHEFVLFVTGQCHILAKYPTLTFQQAANQPDSTAPAIVAQHIQEIGHESRPWLSRINKPRDRSVCLLNLIGHSDYVTGCAYSPDGKRIISASCDHTLKMWDANTGEELATIAGHTGEVWACAYSPDGSHILSAAGDATIRLWSSETGNEKLIIKGHTSCVRTCAFSPDGRTILSGSDDHSLKLWDTLTGRELATLSGHDSSIKYSIFTVDGRFIVSRDLSKVVKVWDVEKKTVIHTITSKRSKTPSCAISPEGHLLIGCFIDANTPGFEIWDVSAGMLIKTIRATYNSGNSVFSPDGAKCLIGDGKTVCLIDSQTGFTLAILGYHRDTVRGVAFSPDGTRPLCQYS